jgi:hypothetical protein
MSINPYESPQPDSEIVVSKRARDRISEPNPVAVWVSFTTIAAAGAIGGLLFVGLMYGLHQIGAHSVAFQVAISVASSASLLVLLAVDWNYRRRTPPYVSCFLGMLLASPVAYLVAFCLGLYAYDLGTKGQAGPWAWAVGMSVYFSFFLTLSAAGEMAIRLARPSPLAPEIERRRGGPGSLIFKGDRGLRS